MPLLQASRIPSLKIRDPSGMVVEEYGNCFLMPEPDGLTLIRRPRGFTLELDGKTNPTIEAFFGDVEVFDRKPMFPMLGQFISKHIAQAIRRFEEFVDSRTP
jgi:hypothetical protein